MNWVERKETPCEQCGHLHWLIVGETNKGGHQIHRMVCENCGYRAPVLVPKTVMQNHAQKVGCEIAYAPPPDDAKECEVCGSVGAEEHHWAPWYLFGSDSDKWPTGFLCPSCHARWHQVISGVKV